MLSLTIIATTLAITASTTITKMSIISLVTTPPMYLTVPECGLPLSFLQICIFFSQILENGQKNEAVDQSSNSDIPSDGTMEMMENMTMYEFIFVNYTQPFQAS